ncbi:PI-PLC X domain-containing protein 1-like isoform X2 [Stegodyphus dumicola]|nr:PI-PLC X domain-containing protein 1-like isoform X2 [Stegodyphus dumicola]
MRRSYSFVGLYSHDPKTNLRDHLFMYKPSDCPEGRIETNFSFPYFDFDKKNLFSRCLGYWAVYLEAGRIVHSTCLRTNPDWMYNMKNIIGDMTFNCLMIPGTHNSGCYSKYNPLKDTVYEKYVYTQEESIFNQLVYGIRCIDLRVWHEGSVSIPSKIQITHDRHRMGLPSLTDVLQDVKDFINATKEIVIIDIHRQLTGMFNPQPLQKWQHKDIVDLVKITFGKYLIEHKYSELPLKFLWKMDKRVLVTYKYENYDLIDSAFSLAVHHWWAGAQNVDYLHEYLLNKACSNPYYPTAAVAVLTASKWMPVIDPTMSLRKMAEKVNYPINKWFRNELSCSNIILTDYFQGNNLIEIAIEANKNASRCLDAFHYYYYQMSDLAKEPLEMYPFD